MYINLSILACYLFHFPLYLAIERTLYKKGIIFMSEIHISEKHFTSAPTDGNRLPKEMAVYELLDKLKIPYEGVDHDVAGTMEECAAVDEASGLQCARIYSCAISKKQPFPVIDTRRQKIHDERSFEAAWHLKTFFCRAGIYGKISEYHSWISKCSRTDERQRLVRRSFDRQGLNG